MGLRLRLLGTWLLCSCLGQLVALSRQDQSARHGQNKMYANGLINYEISSVGYVRLLKGSTAGWSILHSVCCSRSHSFNLSLSLGLANVGQLWAANEPITTTATAAAAVNAFAVVQLAFWHFKCQLRNKSWPDSWSLSHSVLQSVSKSSCPPVCPSVSQSCIHTLLNALPQDCYRPVAYRCLIAVWFSS